MKFARLTWENDGYVIVKCVEPPRDLIIDAYYKTRIYAMHIYGSKRGYEASGTCFWYSGFKKIEELDPEWVVNEHFIGLL